MLNVGFIQGPPEWKAAFDAPYRKQGDYDEYELESEEAGPVLQLVGRVTFQARAGSRAPARLPCSGRDALAGAGEPLELAGLGVGHAARRAGDIAPGDRLGGHELG